MVRGHVRGHVHWTDRGDCVESTSTGGDMERGNTPTDWDPPPTADVVDGMGWWCGYEIQGERQLVRTPNPVANKMGSLPANQHTDLPQPNRNSVLFLNWCLLQVPSGNRPIEPVAVSDPTPTPLFLIPSSWR